RGGKSEGYTCSEWARQRAKFDHTGHSAHGETGGIGRAMEIAHRIEAPVLMVHEPIEGIGGTMRAREAIGARELRPFATEFEDHLPERAFWQAPRRPLTQTAQPLGELRPSAGVVDRPDPAQDECACGAITPTACGDFEDRVQETMVSLNCCDGEGS